MGGTGISTRCPSPTARALGLGPAHPRWFDLAAEPSGLRCARLPRAMRYSCRHSPWPALHRPSRGGFAGGAMLPYRAPARGAPMASAAGLSPGGLSAPRHVRPVSCYALSQGWLLLSQPPGCLCAATSLPTEPALGGLSRWSRLFPSRPRILALAASLPGARPGIRSLGRVGKPRSPRVEPVLYLPGRCRPRLHLNAFRGEPAISGFDWHFTPTHGSSGPFATGIGSAVQRALPRLPPGHG
jgi:hypothetical protein